MKLDENDKELDDWRIGVVVRLAKDVPATPQGAPAHKAGTPLKVVSQVKLRNGASIGFTLPSAAALALDVAKKESDIAVAQLKAFAWTDVITPDGPGFSVSEDDTSNLFDFFQKCMVVATFSYQALEVFCNHSIERELKSSINVKRRNKNVLLSPEEVERQLSTSEKLCQVLPNIYGAPTPKGKKVWEPYKKLQYVRDASIHLKSKDQKATDINSLYYEYLSGGFAEFPKTAGNMIHHFIRGREPRWLTHWLLKNV